jgi:hypothetical protein
MRWVAQDVQEDTNRQQKPWNNHNLTHDFYFVPRDRTPVYMMMGLSALAGFLTGIFHFDPAGNYISIADKPSLALTGLLFGLAIAYGVYRWGRRSWWAVASAVLITTASAALSKVLLVPMLRNTPKPGSTITELFGQTEFLILVNSVIAAGMVFAVGVVAAGAVSSRSLRRPEVLSFALLAGGIVALFYILVEAVKTLLGLNTPGHDPISIAQMIGLWSVSALWHAMLGFCIGYGFMTYVPRNRGHARS